MLMGSLLVTCIAEVRPQYVPTKAPKGPLAVQPQRQLCLSHIAFSRCLTSELPLMLLLCTNTCCMQNHATSSGTYALAIAEQASILRACSGG